MATPDENANAPAVVRTASGELSQRSGSERSADDDFFRLYMETLPKFGPLWNAHQLVFLKRQNLSRILYYHEIYQHVLKVPGVICEFGVQWGASTALLMNLRGMYEPFNYSRTIIGFDTFEGFSDVDAKDGGLSQKGDYATAKDYREVLQQILEMQESYSPLPHIRKFELVKGDASVTAKKWCDDNKHAVIAMAIFDMDVYKPTRDALEAVMPRLTKGSVLVFDELNCKHFPGETLALAETIGLGALRLRRHEHQPYCAYAIYGE